MREFGLCFLSQLVCILSACFCSHNMHNQMSDWILHLMLGQRERGKAYKRTKRREIDSVCINDQHHVPPPPSL